MKKKISLTFDDGPWGQNTQHVIEVLKKYRIPATFMIWGVHARQYSELLKAEARDPLFSLGNHTFHHCDLTKISPEKGKEEINKNDKCIRELTGSIPEYVRVPYGNFDDQTLSYINRPIILWSLDTKSWEHHDCQQSLRNIKKLKMVTLY